VCGEDASSGTVQPAQLLPGASGGRDHRISAADLLPAVAGYSANVCDLSVSNAGGAFDVGPVWLEVDSGGEWISLGRGAVWAEGVSAWSRGACDASADSAAGDRGVQSVC